MNTLTLFLLAGLFLNINGHTEGDYNTYISNTNKDDDNDQLFKDLYKGGTIDTNYVVEPVPNYQIPFTDIPINPSDDKATLLAKSNELKAAATASTYISHNADLRSNDVRAVQADITQDIASIAVERGEIAVQVSILRKKIDDLTQLKDEKAKEIDLINVEIHNLKLKNDYLAKVILESSKKQDWLTRLIDDIKLEIDHFNLQQDRWRRITDQLLLKSDQLNLYSVEMALGSSNIGIEAALYVRDKTEGVVLSDYYTQQANRFTAAAAAKSKK